MQRLYNFLRQYPLDYPDYAFWLEKCRRELEIGYKKAFVCRQDGAVAANLIFQRHKDDPLVLEIKNSRVEPHCRNQGIFRSLIECTETYAIGQRFKRIVCDCHIENAVVIEAMKSLGFRIECAEELYEKGRLEAVLVKEI